MPKLKRKEDAIAIRRYLESRVKEFFATGGIISAIEIGYEVSQAGWVFVHADRREQHERDGAWTARIDCEDEKVLELKHWVGVDPAEAGEFILKIVQAAQADGVFSLLNPRGAFELDVEDFDGEWAWPEYDQLAISQNGPTSKESKPNTLRQAWIDAEAAKDAAITDIRCQSCSRPCPSYRKTCKYCGKPVAQ